MLLWSTLILLTEGVLGIIDLLDYLPLTTNDEQYYSQIIGFYFGKEVTSLEYVQMTVPDSLVWIASLFMQILLIRARSAVPIKQKSALSPTKSLLFFNLI